MSWGQIKHAVNDYISVPLNRQKERLVREVITLGGQGDNHVGARNLTVTGAGRIYDIVTDTNNTPFIMDVNLDGEPIIEGLAVSGNSNRLSRTSNAGQFLMGSTVANFLDGGVALSFNQELNVRVRQANFVATTNPVNITFFIGVDKESSLMLSRPEGMSFRRLIFSSSATIQINNPIEGNTAKAYVIGAGGTTFGFTHLPNNVQTPHAQQWFVNHPANWADYVEGDIPFVQGDTIEVLVGGGNPVRGGVGGSSSISRNGERELTSNGGGPISSAITQGPANRPEADSQAIAHERNVAAWRHVPNVLGAGGRGGLAGVGRSPHGISNPPQFGAQLERPIPTNVGNGGMVVIEYDVAQ